MDGKPQATKKPRLASDMLEGTIVHHQENGNETYMCQDMMPDLIVNLFHGGGGNNYWSTSMIDDLQELTIVGILAVAGHLLGYSACVPATQFNRRVHVLAAKAKGNREEAFSWYQVSKLCRFIIAANLLIRLDRFYKEKVNYMMQSAIERENSPTGIATTGLSITPATNQLSESRITYTGASPASFTTMLDGTELSIDSSEFLFSTMRETAELTPLRNSGISKFLASLQTEKVHMRGQTLLLVLGKSTSYHLDDCKVIEANVELSIAGYPTHSNKKLGQYKFEMSLLPIDKPPPNIETLFARAIVAANKCLKKPANQKRQKNNGVVKISGPDALDWRDDEFLGKYTVAGLFKPKKQGLQQGI